MNINYKSYQDEIVALRRHFHMYPETAFNEIKTTEFIKNYLENGGTVEQARELLKATEEEIQKVTKEM